MVCIKPGVVDSDVLVGESFSSAMRGNIISPGITIPDGVLTRAEVELELEDEDDVVCETSHIIVSSIMVVLLVVLLAFELRLVVLDEICCSHCSIKRLQADVDADDRGEDEVVFDCWE